jgi:hypothetical protein
LKENSAFDKHYGGDHAGVLAKPSSQLAISVQRLEEFSSAENGPVNCLFLQVCCAIQELLQLRLDPLLGIRRPSNSVLCGQSVFPGLYFVVRQSVVETIDDILTVLQEAI